MHILYPDKVKNEIRTFGLFNKSFFRLVIHIVVGKGVML